MAWVIKEEEVEAEAEEEEEDEAEAEEDEMEAEEEQGVWVILLRTSLTRSRGRYVLQICAGTCQRRARREKMISQFACMIF